jgi:hypothetical protein
MNLGKRVALALASVAGVAGGVYLAIVHFNDHPRGAGMLGYVGFLLFLAGLGGLVYTTDKR